MGTLSRTATGESLLPGPVVPRYEGSPGGMGVMERGPNQDRIDALTRKRQKQGLSRDEEDELGLMLYALGKGEPSSAPRAGEGSPPGRKEPPASEPFSGIPPSAGDSRVEPDKGRGPWWLFPASVLLMVVGIVVVVVTWLLGFDPRWEWAIVAIGALGACWSAGLLEEVPGGW